MRRLPFALALAAPAVLRAQQVAATPPGPPAGLPPARPLGPVVARATEVVGSLAAVRALPGGRLLVNDVMRRRVILFDSALTSYTVVADTTGATGNAYAGRVAGLIPYRGDSTLFVDPQSLSMLVIDPAGKLGRTLSVPRSGDAFALVGLGGGTPGFDARGRLVYRAPPDMRRLMAGAAAGGAMPSPPDSAPLVRVDLATRQLDTVTFLKVPAPKVSVTRNGNGDVTGVNVVHNPLPVVDEWAVLSDGTIAVVRGRDFHADFVGADGVLRPAPKMPHDWQRLGDEQKVAFLDSTRTAMEKQRAEMQATVDKGTASAGGARMQIMVGGAGRPDTAPPTRGPAGGGAAGGAGAMATALSLVPPSELPDYKPPFAAGGARADADGRVWVRLIPTRPMPGPVYAVVDGSGKEVDRVVLPAGASIAGFGPGGVVYLGVREGTTGVRLQRARVR